MVKRNYTVPYSIFLLVVSYEGFQYAVDIVEASYDSGQDHQSNRVQKGQSGSHQPIRIEQPRAERTIWWTVINQSE